MPKYVKIDPASDKVIDAGRWPIERFDADPDVKELVGDLPEDVAGWKYDSATKTLIAATSSLSLSPTSPASVTPDGVDTQVVTITGPADAVVNIECSVLLPISTLQVTLDDGGSGTFTLGPTSLRSSQSATLTLDLDDGTDSTNITYEVSFA